MDKHLARSAGYISPDDIMEIAGAFQRSRVLLTAFELGIFSELEDARKGSAEVARALGADERAADRLMNALCAIGLLHKEGGKFSNATHAARFLVKGRPGYMAGLMHTANMWETWGTLTEAVRRGKSVAGKGPWERGEKWVEAFIAAMHYRAVWQAPEVVKLIDASKAKRLLDIGGGSGAYSAAFIRTNDGMRATVFDLPNVIELAKRYVAEEGLSDGVDFVAGDYNGASLGDGYDIAFLSAILHSNSPSQNASLLKKAARALNAGGQAVVQDFIVDEERAGPPFAALFALNMLVATERGDTYTESEVRGWMEGAGLSDIERKDTGVGTALIIGRKGGA